MKKIPRKEDSAIIKKEKVKQIPRKESPVIIKSEKKTLRKETPVIIKKEKVKQIPRKEPTTVKPESPIYFKLGHEESIESKKDLLILESSFLNMLKIMRDYNALRREELKIKSDMYRAVKRLDSSIKRTTSIFPFLEMPERLKRKEVPKVEPVQEIKPSEEVLEDDLEIQLRDIQSRLRSLGG